MTGAADHRRWPRLGRTVRFRLAVRYAALFLVSGSVLLAISYGLVAHSLSSGPAAKASTYQVGKIRKECEQSKRTAAAKGGAAEPVAENRPAIEKCVNAYLAGLENGATNQRDRTLGNLLLYSLLGLGALTVVSGGLGWMMAGRVLRPIQAITHTARRASDEHLGERVALDGPADELKELADTFDEMLDRLDDAFTSQRAFVANASHELRTPLTVMRTAIDVTLAKPVRSREQLETMAEKVRSSVDHAEQLIDALLTLARSDRGTDTAEFLDLATACEDALETVEDRVTDRELKLSSALEPAEIIGDRLLLERMVGNLVDNATRHSGRGGWVHIRTGRRDGSVYLEVVNTGDTIPGDLAPLLVEPFRRVESRLGGPTGVGLGLAIVKTVAERHGGSVKVSARPGGGLVVLVQLPLGPEYPLGVTVPRPRDLGYSACPDPPPA